jgi:hypothetical protein
MFAQALGVPAGSFQCVAAYGDVSHIPISGCQKSYTTPRLLLDGLGYFVVLTGMLFCCASHSWLTSFPPAVNVTNMFLFRSVNYSIQSSG